MGIVLTDNYKVLRHNTEEATGDFTVEFQIQISDADFKDIVAKIKQTENYGEYKNGESPNSFSSFENYKISGFKIEDKYFYKKESTSNSIYYELVLSAGKKLKFSYAED